MSWKSRLRALWCCCGQASDVSVNGALRTLRSVSHWCHSQKDLWIKKKQDWYRIINYYWFFKRRGEIGHNPVLWIQQYSLYICTRKISSLGGGINFRCGKAWPSVIVVSHAAQCEILLTVFLGELGIGKVFLQESWHWSERDRDGLGRSLVNRIQNHQSQWCCYSKGPCNYLIIIYEDHVTRSHDRNRVYCASIFADLQSLQFC